MESNGFLLPDEWGGMSAKDELSATGKTAIARNKPSRPLLDYLNHLEEEGVDLQSKRWIDYGCGRGADVEHLTGRVGEVVGYDPNWTPKLSLHDIGTADIVTCTFVLNVISDEDTRSVALRTAMNLVGQNGRIMVACRSKGEVKSEARKSGWQETSDGGYDLGGYRYQRGFTRKELAELFDNLDYDGWSEGKGLGKGYTALTWQRKPHEAPYYYEYYGLTST